MEERNEEGEAFTYPERVFGINTLREVIMDERYSQNHQAAVAYVKRFGFSVLPIAPKEKYPLTTRGYKDASSDLEQIKKWFLECPNANVGIATEQSGLLVLDIDDSPEISALDTLSELERKYGSIPDTPHVLTGGGGYQFYFKSDEKLSSKIKILPNIDVKASGGYVVAPPSIHPSGKKYQWESLHKITDLPLSRVPQFIQDLTGQSKAEITKKPIGFWAKFYAQGADKGRRNDSIAKFAGYLLRMNVDALLVVEIIMAWNKEKIKPPLNENEILRTLDSIAQLEIQRRGN
jgi:hypothetical protein